MNTQQVRESNKHAQAILHGVRGSYIKINIILDEIRGKSVAEASAVLKFMYKKHSPIILKLLNSAIDNADRKGLISNLSVIHAYASRAKVLKRIDIKGRGRSGVAKKPYSHISLVVGQQEDKVIKSKAIKVKAVDSTLKSVGSKSAKAKTVKVENTEKGEE